MPLAVENGESGAARYQYRALAKEKERKVKTKFARGIGFFRFFPPSLRAHFSLDGDEASERERNNLFLLSASISLSPLLSAATCPRVSARCASPTSGSVSGLYASLIRCTPLEKKEEKTNLHSFSPIAKTAH